MNVDTPFGVNLMKRDDETVYAYFLSFSPMAPFFGVPWRFADMMQPDPAFARAAERTAFKASETAEKAAEESVRTARRAAETMTRQGDATVRLVEDAVEVASETAAERAARTVEAARTAPEAVRKSAPAPAPAPKPAPAKAETPAEPVAKAEPKADAKAEPKAEAAGKPAAAKANGKDADLFGDARAVDRDAGKPEGLLAKAPAKADDLKEIKGIGPKLEAELNDLGIYTFAQIAGLSEENLAWVAGQLASVRGRGLRGDMVEQARALAG